MHKITVASFPASVPLGLVSTQADSCSTCPAKLLFCQNGAAVVMIVDFAHIQGYEEWREGVFARNELNIRAKAPFPLLSRSSVQRGGGAYFGSLWQKQKQQQMKGE